MKPAAVFDLIKSPHYYLKRHEYIFLLSHMRCYSSLLGHILGNNPEIAGFAELHLSYYKYHHMLRMKRRVHNMLDGKVTGKRYIFDKLLNNKLYLSPDVVRSGRTQVIVSVRRPESTISSIINMGNKLHDDGWYTDQESVVRYYVSRLNVLCEYMEIYSKICGRKIIFFEAESIIERSADVLSELSAYLNLLSPLTESYKTFSDTGRPGIGDPSQNIKAGSIVRAKPESKINNISRDVLNFAYGAYDACLATADRYCDVIG